MRHVVDQCCSSLLYSAILHSQADSLCLHVILHEWLAVHSAFLNLTKSRVLTVLAWLAPHETAAISVQSHTHKVHECLAVTCHLHFWQNDWDLLCVTAVTRGWNRYRNKSQHGDSWPDPGEENPPAAPAGIRTHNLSITSPVLQPLSYSHSLSSSLHCPHSHVLVDGKVIVGNCHRLMADTGDQETAVLVAVLLPCQS